MRDYRSLLLSGVRTAQFASPFLRRAVGPFLSRGHHPDVWCSLVAPFRFTLRGLSG
jgi:hypothetical protein